MCTLSIMPGHERLKVGALASVLRKHPRPAVGTAHVQPGHRWLAMIANSLPQKELDNSSMSSTPIEKEPVMECPLLLTALSGVTFKVSLSVAKFDRFTDLEDQVMDYLASVTDFQVFGCVIDFLHTTTQTYLEDPIWDKLQQGREYTLSSGTVVLPCQNKNSSVVILLIKSP